MAMLKREDLPMAAVPGTSDLNALLGRGSEFEGKLTFEGTVRIDGKFTGTIVTNDVLVVGEGAKIAAEITCGTIIVHGEINGNIVTNDVLVVGEGAKIQAEITCGTIIVHGEINGDIQAKTAVELHHPARMKGNIETPSLMIEKGVAFEGQCKMDVTPEKGTKPLPSPAPSVSPMAAIKPS